MNHLREEIEGQMEEYYYLEDYIYKTMTKDEILDVIKRTDLIHKTVEELDYYVDLGALTKKLEIFPQLTTDIILSFVGDFKEGIKNRCLICQVDMGRSNPRQLCGKWMCHNDYIRE